MRENVQQEFTKIAKVKVGASGTIHLNGKMSTLEELKREFAQLSQDSGAAVWYYRENPQDDPHPKALEVMEAVIDAKLPVRLCEHDFE